MGIDDLRTFRCSSVRHPSTHFAVGNIQLTRIMGGDIGIRDSRRHAHTPGLGGEPLEAGSHIAVEGGVR